ncbi:hypothetical protein SAMN05518672_102500 [Chitinophaga sp. CF118]|nr:hypothetical protein SAMN05518672_102500 [Chitinophaga sp. CF118]
MLNCFLMFYSRRDAALCLRAIEQNKKTSTSYDLKAFNVMSDD